MYPQQPTFFFHTNQQFDSNSIPNQQQQQQQQHQQLLQQLQQPQQTPSPPPLFTTTTTTGITHHKRTYVTRACDHCRQRRAVCDNQKPKCSRCQKRRIDCTFLVPQRKRGPVAKPKDSGPDPNQDHEILAGHSNATSSNNTQLNNKCSMYTASTRASSNTSSPNNNPIDNTTIHNTTDINNAVNNRSSSSNANSNTTNVVTNAGFILKIDQATDAEHRVEDEESSIFHQFIRSPSEIPWPKAADPMEGYHSNLGDPVGHSHQHSFKQPTVHDDIFSKPVVDHLVTLFFEHCFQDFDFFSPLAFLRLYAQGTVHQCLLDMICGLGARFSDHPAVAKNPNYMSGEPYVERVKAKMGQLISDVSMDTLHTFILMNFYEFSTGQHRLGYRIECLAFVMASDLRLSHFYQQASARPSFTVSSTSSSSPASSPTKMYHESEAERVAAEVKIRTLKFLLISDLYSSSVSGLTPKFNHSVIHPSNSSVDTKWWVERPQGIGSFPLEPVDDFSASILYKVLLPRPTQGSVDSNHSVMFLDLVNSVCTFAKTEYTLNKWKEYMNTERKVTDSGSSSGGGCNRPSFSASLSPIPGPSSMSTLSPGPLSNVMSSGPVSGPVSLPLPPNFDQSETFQQSGSPSVPDRFHSQYQRHMPPPIALAPPFPTHPTAANYPCAIPTYSPTTPESPVHSAIPHHSTPPPPFPPSTINPSTASTKAADTSSQWRGDQSEYARLDSEFESWKSQLSLDFNPSHGKLSLFKTDKVLHVGSCYYAMAILLHKPSLIPGVFLSQLSSFESSRDNFSVKTGSDGRATSRSQGGARGSSTAERQQGEGSSRGGTSRQGASAGITKDGVSETKFLETSSSVGHQQYRQQLFAEEMEGVVSFSGMKRGGIMQQQQSETMTNATALTIERTPLDKCTELANEVSTMIEAFSDEMIKYRGHAFAFQVFIAATTHITNLATSHDPFVIAYSQERLNGCFHFLETLRPYWASVEHQMMVLRALISCRDRPRD